MELDVRVRVHRSTSIEALGGLAAVLLALNAIAAIGMALVGAPLGRTVLQLLVAGAVGWAWHQTLGNRRRRVRAGADGLRVGRTLYPRRAMRAGFVLGPEHGLPARVYLDGEQRLTLEVATVDEGAALVSALGLTHRGRAHRYRVNGPLPFGRRTAAGLALLALVLVVGAFFSPVGAYLISAFAVAAFFHEPIFAWLRACTVDVGSDGVCVQSRRGTRFVPAEALVDVDDRDGGLTLVTREGAVRVAEPDSADVERIVELERRIREVLAARTEPSAVAEELLARGDAPVADWLAGLRVRVEQGYRSASLGNDDLERVLGSASSPSARVGAAVLLRARGAEPSRLRVAAEAVAEPRLRVALVAVAEGSPEHELEQAVAALEKG